MDSSLSADDIALMYSLVRRYLKTAIVFLIGFVMMMILGVALWLFPRPARDDRRYTPRIAEATYWFLTIGTAARIGGEIERPFTAALAIRVATFSAALLQATGLGLFFYTMWSRIRSARSRAREGQGERF